MAHDRQTFAAQYRGQCACAFGNGGGKAPSAGFVKRGVLRDVIIGASDKAQRNSMLVEGVLQLLSRLSDLRARIRVETGQDVGRACQVRYAVGNRCPVHVQRDRKIASAVVDTGQDMAMQINHETSNSQCLATDDLCKGPPLLSRSVRRMGIAVMMLRLCSDRH